VSGRARSHFSLTSVGHVVSWPLEEKRKGSTGESRAGVYAPVRLSSCCACRSSDALSPRPEADLWFGDPQGLLIMSERTRGTAARGVHRDPRICIRYRCPHMKASIRSRAARRSSEWRPFEVRTLPSADRLSAVTLNLASRLRPHRGRRARSPIQPGIHPAANAIAAGATPTRSRPPANRARAIAERMPIRAIHHQSLTDERHQDQGGSQIHMGVSVCGEILHPEIAVAPQTPLAM